MAKKNQYKRLTTQHKESFGAVGIYGKEAQTHDANIHNYSAIVLSRLEKEYPKLQFRHRAEITKKEINESLCKLDSSLGQTLFVTESKIKPDGGLIEVKDDTGSWRVVLISEAKHQGKDIDNIKNGILVGKLVDQDIMTAGNAIERAHKNIMELANYMLAEDHFPFVLFLEGSNFLTADLVVIRPDGRKVTLKHDSGTLNRIDRLTAANYGMKINTNLCKNKYISKNGNSIMLQATSIYTQGDGKQWKKEELIEIMLDVARTSLQVLGRDLFKQLTK